MQILLDTAIPADAAACGYEAPTPHDAGGLRISAESHPAIGPVLVINGAEGEVAFIGEAAIRELIRAANRALRMSGAAVEPAFKMTAE